MLRIFLLVGVLFSQTPVWCAIQEPVTRIQYNENSKIYWTLYYESGVAKIDVIEEKNGEPQQLINSWGFSDMQKAEKFYAERTQNLATFSNLQWSFETLNIETQVNKKIWEAKNSWNWDWELKYAKWVADNIDKTFMQKHQIPSDCADLAYITRWIFARENSLPVANKLSSTGKFMTHETVLKEWENLSTHPDWSKDKLFRAALRYLTRQTYTHTVMRDSYPIALNSEAMTEGVHHLQLHEKSGHTMLVYKVDRTGGVPLRVLYSNMPIEIRELYESPFSDISWPVQDQRAFLRFRWPQKTGSGWNLVASTAMPYYSLEQFAPEIQKEGPSFFVVAFKRIAPNFNPLTLVEETLGSLFSQLENRVKIVEEGFRFCQSNDCSPGTPGDEAWSTPSRDKRLKETFEAFGQVLQLYKQVSGNQQIPEEILAKIENYRLTIQNQTYGFLPLYVSTMLMLMEFDPRVSIDERWTLKTPIIAARIEKMLEVLFDSRTKKISVHGSCSESECPTGSKKWLEKSTLAEDQEISSVFFRLSLVCEVIKSTCAEFNSLFKQNSKFKSLFSKAVTQHTSASSSLKQRMGHADYRAQFVPNASVPIAFAENVFVQSGTLYRQSPDDVFPEKLCSDALLKPKDKSTVVCVSRTGNDLHYEFYNNQLQSLSKIDVPNGIDVISDRHWLKNSDIFLLKFTNMFRLYSAQGLLIEEFTTDQAFFFFGQRWLVSLGEDGFPNFLDLTQTQKGWVRHQTRALETLNDATYTFLESSGNFLIGYANETFVTNPAGEVVFHAAEAYLEIYDNGRSLMMMVTAESKTVYKLYQFQNDSYLFVADFNLTGNPEDSTIFKTNETIFYGSKSEGYWMFSIKNLRHQHLPWTQDRDVVQFNDDSVILTDKSEAGLYAYHNLNGQFIFKSKYVTQSYDKNKNLRRIGFFANDQFYNRTYRPEHLATPLFSSTGFFYAVEEELQLIADDPEPLQNANSYAFGISGQTLSMHILSHMNINIDYSSVLLTTPTPIGLQ